MTSERVHGMQGPIYLGDGVHLHITPRFELRLSCDRPGDYGDEHFVYLQSSELHALILEAAKNGFASTIRDALAQGTKK